MFSTRKEVFTFYGPIFVRQQIMVILAAAPTMCVLMLLLMLAIFSRVYLAHSLALPQSTRESARRKKTFARARSAAELVKYLHKNDSPAHSPADIAHNKVEILMVCVTSNAAAFAPRARSRLRKKKMMRILQRQLRLYGTLSWFCEISFTAHGSWKKRRLKTHNVDI